MQLAVYVMCVCGRYESSVFIYHLLLCYISQNVIKRYFPLLEEMLSPEMTFFFPFLCDFAPPLHFYCSFMKRYKCFVCLIDIALRQKKNNQRIKLIATVTQKPVVGACFGAAEPRRVCRSRTSGCRVPAK